MNRVVGLCMACFACMAVFARSANATDGEIRAMMLKLGTNTHNEPLYPEHPETGARTWIWADSYWKHPDEFLKRMPKSVMMSNWYYRDDFSERICDRSQMEKSILAAEWPETVAAPSAYIDLAKAGYDQIPCGSVWASKTNIISTVRFARKRLAGPHLKGFLMAPWVSTTRPNRATLLEAIDASALAFEK